MDENQNDKQDIEIVPGQMCYDELLLPQEEDLKEEKEGNSLFRTKKQFLRELLNIVK